jgi:MoaA/NifB/PqqE/SkfB family radical SAM enzyme
MNEQAQRILSWMKENPAGPYEIELRITNRCNLKCLFCWDWIKEQKTDNELSDNVYLKLVKDAKEMNVKRFHICGGGEQFMRAKTLLRTMIKIKKYQMTGRLITNGTLFTSDSIKKLVSNDWDEIIFSLDAPTSEIHDYLRGVDGTFNKVTEAIKLFSYWKRKFNTKTPRLIIAPVLSNKIYDKVPDMIKLAHNLGAQEVCLQLMIQKTSGCKDFMLNDEEKNVFIKNIQETKRIAKLYNIRCNVEDFLDKTLIEKSSEKKEIFKKDVKDVKEDGIIGSPCFFPWLYMGIFVDGTVQPCADAPEGKEFENIKDKSIKDIWFGNYFNNYRKNLIEKKLFSWCQRCCGNKIIESRGLRKELLSEFKIN